MAKILVIEDDTDVRDMIGKMLKKSGYEVVLAGNGREALELVANSTPDLLITDMFMPEVEGLENITNMRERMPEIPIIAISGGWRGSNLDFLAVAESMGAQRCFRKPVDKDQLLDAVQELLNLSHENHEN